MTHKSSTELGNPKISATIITNWFGENGNTFLTDRQLLERVYENTQLDLHRNSDVITEIELCISARHRTR